MSSLSRAVASLQETTSKQEQAITAIYEQTLTELEKNLQHKLSEKLNILEIATDEILTQHGQKLKKISAKSEQTLNEIESRHRQIEEYHSQVIQSLKWHWWKPTAVGLVFAIAIAGGSWGVLTYLDTRLTETLTELNQRQVMLAKVQVKGNWSTCKGKKCVQIDESAPLFQDGYRILKTD